MEAKELMIGDWVRLKLSQHDTKVTNIGGSYVFTKAVRHIRYDEIEPVPLTPEILEKNGFRIVYESEFHVSYFQDIQGFHTEVKVDKDGIFQKLSMWDGFGNQVTIVECKYVHQLQHALRLCGIPREIII